MATQSSAYYEHSLSLQANEEQKERESATTCRKITKNVNIIRNILVEINIIFNKQVDESLCWWKLVLTLLLRSTNKLNSKVGTKIIFMRIILCYFSLHPHAGPDCHLIQSGSGCNVFS
jgi:hypothetical protein